MLIFKDTRFVFEAARLLLLQSGVRLQRAAIIASARRCLRSYRQNVILVDLGLSDDSGMDFVSEPD